MKCINTNAAILVESFQLEGDEVRNQSLITSIRPRIPKMMASLAKLMTVMLVWDKVKQDAIDPALTLVEMPVGLLRNSSEYYKFYKKGERIPLSTLIESALIASSNEAAFALAYWHSSSERHFVPQMIRKSHLLGLTRSHWTSCSGLERNAYTTVEDMSKLSKIFISQYADIAYYCSLKFFEFNDKKVNNTNRLMHSHSNIKGLKTGTLVGIGSNLINYWVDDDMHYVSIVLGAENRGICYGISEEIMYNCASSKIVQS
jgi:D-alanyl-D-alanine carboxypeptidase